jgi:uncharacterized membrane protein
MGQTEFLLTLALTVVLTTLIVLCANWIEKNKKKHPELHKRRGLIASMLYVLMNLKDFG